MTKMIGGVKIWVFEFGFLIRCIMRRNRAEARMRRPLEPDVDMRAG